MDSRDLGHILKLYLFFTVVVGVETIRLTIFKKISAMNYISRSFGGELLLLLNRSHKMPPFLREDLSFLKMTFFSLKRR